MNLKIRRVIREGEDLAEWWDNKQGNEGDPWRAYYFANASDPSMLAASSFDTSLANMTLDDMKNADGAERESARVLRDDDT